MVLLQVLCCSIPEESVQLKEWLACNLHLPVKIASNWDAVFDIKHLFKMSEAEKELGES